MKSVQFYRIRNQLARLGIPRSEIDIIMQTAAAEMIPYGKTLVGCENNVVEYRMFGDS